MIQRRDVVHYLDPFKPIDDTLGDAHHGCPVLQGYLLGRPASVDDFLRLYD